MNLRDRLLIFFLLFSIAIPALSQRNSDERVLTLDRIYRQGEFRAERAQQIQWMAGGSAYTVLEPSTGQTAGQDIVRYRAVDQERSVLVTAEQLIPEGADQPLAIDGYQFTDNGRKLLLFTNSQRVWRANTRGDYWVYNLDNQELTQLGKRLPEASLMFAKFLNGNQQVAYVSRHNLYAEDIASGNIMPLTRDGNEDIINGTFDWVYEEELFCRDGFRPNPNGQEIAFWQLDASDIGDFLMINNTDSVYSQTIPVQYPKVGFKPSAAKVGVVSFQRSGVQWIPIPGGERENYLPRMQWVNESTLLITQMNRKQNEYKLWTYKPERGQLENIYTETDEAYVDIIFPDVNASRGMDPLPVVDNDEYVLRLTEKDGWRHIYKIRLEDGQDSLLTDGEFDVARMYRLDRENGYAYFSASPDNSTRRYLYRVSYRGEGGVERLTPEDFAGVNDYQISPNGQYAIHTYSNASTPPEVRLVSLPGHGQLATLVDNEALKDKLKKLDEPEVEFFQVTTREDVTLDGMMIKPPDFDDRRQYPVIFHVYGEPWGQMAVDAWSDSRAWDYLLAQRGYIVVKMDNRGTPCLKGREWRKSIYRKIGIINTRDQALGARQVLNFPYIDPRRVAVWGWSGGGSMTLNLLFQYPDLYQTGVSVAPVTDLRYYDNLYEERYMGLLSENPEDYEQGSPITHAGNLRGNLLLIHGTADDNVHYQHAEALINELIRQDKQFDFMAYPNRSHGIYEGENTTPHLRRTILEYLMEHCEAGGR